MRRMDNLYFVWRDLTMKKVIYFVPFIFYLLVILFAAFTVGISSINTVAYPWLVLFLVSGILLSRNMFWGGAFGCLPAAHWVYNGMNNWKLGHLEIWTGVICLLFYLICSAWLFYYNSKKTK